MRNNKNRRVHRVVMLVLCMVLLMGCQKTSIEPGDGNVDASNAKRYKVVLLTKATDSAFWGSVYSGANAASSEYNLDLLFEGPGNEEDYETQNLMIEQAVKDGVDAIVFSAVDYKANADAINAAAKAGVKIIVIDSDVDSDRVSCRISTDNYEAGRTAGEEVLNTQEEMINVGIVNFDEITENGQSRERGLRETIAKDERTTVVDSINVRSSTEDAKEETIQMLKFNPQINVVVTFNEWTSLGVGYAIKELGLADEVKVVAFDSNVVSVGMLETGEVDALIVQNPYAMGYLGVESAYNLVNGYPLKFEEINTPTILVTRENMYDDKCQRALFAFDKEY